MKWHALPGILAAICLPMPLILLLTFSSRTLEQVSAGHGSRISPVLDVEERTRLSTYKRRCKTSADCEPPLGCLVDGRHGIFYCIDSQCTADTQCPEGLVCRGIETLGGGPVVNLCVPIGPRRQGERCSTLSRRGDVACIEELRCGGRQGWCGSRCSLHEDGSCPKGFFCADMNPEPLCLPTCQQTGCPEGQQCIRYDDGVSACAEVYGDNCQQSSCPSTQECRVRDFRVNPAAVWLACTTSCKGKGAVCPAGHVCLGYSCEPSCQPDAPGACGEGFRCIQRREGSPWRCVPDW
ncbi:hypothetical protein SAMN05444354_113179 [Stigmatella aurantiaca]|uniref:Uncharacterized protein n=1 Tax=Stigmatella aurantiaca TaxID=41 RepID=A0A1H7WSY0_STIAU|nr:hypothetical protein SAMN05444354_113179 [Stigmatella aurantiaca]